MRTLQEKYNGIQEGKFSKENFLADARKELPNLVTRFNGYNDAVQILKNKGMIREVSAEESFKDYSNDALTDMIINSSRFEGNEEGIARVKAELERRKQAINEAKQPKATKKGLADYRYKPTNEMDKYPYEQILRGLRVELEQLGVQGTPTAEEYAKALAKVSKNLAKDSIFYTNQVAGVNPKVDQHDQMLTATAKNTVDTFNGMKKAELKEGFKKLIKKVLSEDEGRASRGVEYGEPNEEEYDFYSNPEDYKDENEDEWDDDRGLESEPDEEEFELQEAKEDSHYKSELADYLEDNQIYGYTDRIHDIMTGPDEADALDRLTDYLKEEGIYGYTRAIEEIYADYPYDQHWMNQPDEEGDEIDYDDENFSDPFIDGDLDENKYAEADAEADRKFILKLMGMYEYDPSKYENLHREAEMLASTESDPKYKHMLGLIEKAKEKALQSLANQDRYQAGIEGMDEDLYEGNKSLSELLK